MISERVFSQFHICQNMYLSMIRQQFNAHNSDLDRALVCDNLSET